MGVLSVHHGRVGGVQPGVDPVNTGPTAGVITDQLRIHLLSLLQQGGVTQDLLETEVQSLTKVGKVYISSQCGVLQRRRYVRMYSRTLHIQIHL